VEFKAAVWISIDGATRPDLVEEARLGALRRLTCPNGHEARFTLPLLIQIEGDDPAIVYCPIAEERAEIQRQFETLLEIAGLAPHDSKAVDAAFAKCCLTPIEDMGCEVAFYDSRHVLIGSTPRMRSLVREAQATSMRLRSTSELRA